MSEWIIGYAAGGAATVVVVVLLAMMISGAGRVAAQADAIVAALDRSRVHTEPLWKLADTNQTAASVVATAAGIRHALGAEEA